MTRCTIELDHKWNLVEKMQ